MIGKRLQLTLFVAPSDAIPLELARQKFNPAQFGLIKSHVTICREDEIEPLEIALDNLKNRPPQVLEIEFGAPIRFADGKGVLLPAVGENRDFQALRHWILAGIVENPRRHEPHITLMHPRNSACTDSIFEEIRLLSFPEKLRFKTASLIEQVGGGPWRILEDFSI